MIAGEKNCLFLCSRIRRGEPLRSPNKKRMERRHPCLHCSYFNGWKPLLLYNNYESIK